MLREALARFGEARFGNKWTGDELYARDGTCLTGPEHVDPIFGHFTALPPANDFEAICTPATNECDGLPRDLRFTVDAAGNALVPMDWRGVLLRPDGIPVPRLVRGDTSLEAFLGGGAAVRLPGASFVASYSPGGLRVPPIFEPVTSEHVASPRRTGPARGVSPSPQACPASRGGERGSVTPSRRSSPRQRIGGAASRRHARAVSRPRRDRRRMPATASCRLEHRPAQPRAGSTPTETTPPHQGCDARRCARWKTRRPCPPQSSDERKDRVCIVGLSQVTDRQ